MRMLADQQDEAFELLTLAVQKPRFDAAPIDRIRSQIVAGIVANERDPETQAAQCMGCGDLWRPSLFAAGRGHRAVAGDDHRRRSARLPQGQLRARQPPCRGRRRNRCRDPQEAAGSGLRRPAGEAATAPVGRVDPKLGQEHRRSNTICRRPRCSWPIPACRARRRTSSRRLSDEPDPRRRHLLVAPVRRSAREARAGLQRQFFADQPGEFVFAE